MDILDKLNMKFVYTPDKKELWRYLDLSQETVKGDCEDYVLTLQKELGGSIYFCKVSGWGHAVLKLDDLWIDCITKEWVHKFPSSYFGFKKISWLGVKWRVFKGYLKTKLGKV